MIHLAFTKWIQLEIAMTCGTKERNLQVFHLMSYRFFNSAAKRGKMMVEKLQEKKLIGTVLIYHYLSKRISISLKSKGITSRIFNNKTIESSLSMKI